MVSKLGQSYQEVLGMIRDGLMLWLMDLMLDEYQAPATSLGEVR